MDNGFGVGAVLGTGFRVWFKNLLPFLLITTLFYTPLIAWGVIAAHAVDITHLSQLVTFTRYSGLIMMVMNLVVAAALTFGVIMELQGQRASIGACIATGLSRFFPVLGVALLSGLCLIGGFICLIVPGIIVLCMLYVATPASVIERPGLVGALKRSRELTSGHKLQIFGLLLLLGLITWVLQAGTQMIVVPHLRDPGHFAETLKALPSYVYAELIRAIVLCSISSVMSAVAYAYLRKEKEGTTAEELARVFE